MAICHSFESHNSEYVINQGKIAMTIQQEQKNGMGLSITTLSDGLMGNVGMSSLHDHRVIFNCSLKHTSLQSGVQKIL